MTVFTFTIFSVGANQFLSSEARYTAARARVRKRLAHFQKQQPRGPGVSSGSVPPVEGRKHTNLQTEQWLEEIRDRVPENDVAVQTDPTSDSGPGSPRQAFRSPPVTPSVDKATQILPDDPDLFVFDDEVAIVLEALVGKTIEQSLLEVIEEEEKAAESWERERERKYHKLNSM